MHHIDDQNLRVHLFHSITNYVLQTCSAAGTEMKGWHEVTDLTNAQGRKQ